MFRLSRTLVGSIIVNFLVKMSMKIWSPVINKKEREAMHAAIRAKCRERAARYVRLGFARSELTIELIDDDQLWEIAKNLPIDPNNWVDRGNQELDAAMKSVNRGEITEEEAKQRVAEIFRKNLR